MIKTAKGIEKRQKNLIPLDKQSKKKARKLGKKGGIASGVAKRKKKTFKEVAKALLQMKPDKETIKKLKPFLPDLTDEEIDIQMAILARQSQKAIGRGDTTAAIFIRDSAGEKPIEKFEGKVDNKNNIKAIQGLTKKQLDKIIKDTKE